MSDTPSRRDLLRPVQLVGLAFAAAAFAGAVTLVTTGFFQLDIPEARGRAIVLALIVAGVAFIVTLVSIALLVLAVDPAQLAKPVDRPVLLPPADSAEPPPPATRE